MGIIIFFKRNKKWVIKLLSVIFVSIIAFDFLHDLGTLERGYNAFGGEIFMVLIPIFVWLFPEIKKSIKEIKDELSR